MNMLECTVPLARLEPGMTPTKLTVRVDPRWIEAAKRYAASRDTSLSKLISEFLRTLASPDASTAQTPILDRLTGILPADVDVEAHRRHLEDKHLGP